MIELAWFWLRHQPDSALSRWFQGLQARVGALSNLYYRAHLPPGPAVANLLVFQRHDPRQDSAV